MSSPRARIAAGLLALAVSACIDPTMGSPAPDAGRPPPRPPDCLRLPDQIDFGEVERTGRADRQFFLNNNTLKPLSIEIGEVSEPFFGSVSGRARVEPGVPFPLRLSFLPPDGRLHLSTFEFLGGEGCTRQVIPLSGMGAGELLVPSFFDFGPIPVGQPVSRRVAILSSRRDALEVTVTVHGVAFSAPARFSISALGAAELELTATAASHGLFNGAIELFTSKGERVLIGVAATGGVPDLRLDRPTVRVGMLPAPNMPGMPALFQRELTLSNVGDGPLRIDGFAVRANPGSELDELRAVPFNTMLAPNSSSTLLLHFLPRSALGPRSWSIRLTTNQPNLPALEIPITAEVVRVPDCRGAMQLAPSSFSVPAATVPVQAAITITNPFDGECLLDDLRLAPAEWSLSAPEQLLLPPQGSAVVNIALDHAGTAALIFNPVGANVGYANVPVRVQ